MLSLLLFVSVRLCLNQVKCLWIALKPATKCITPHDNAVTRQWSKGDKIAPDEQIKKRRNPGWNLSQNKNLSHSEHTVEYFPISVYVWVAVLQDNTWYLYINVYIQICLNTVLHSQAHCVWDLANPYQMELNCEQNCSIIVDRPSLSTWFSDEATGKKLQE